jgi:hypothetical protein
VLAAVFSMVWWPAMVGFSVYLPNDAGVVGESLAEPPELVLRLPREKPLEELSADGDWDLTCMHRLATVLQIQSSLTRMPSSDYTQTKPLVDPTGFEVALRREKYLSLIQGCAFSME